MKNLLLAFILLFSLQCFAQGSQKVFNFSSTNTGMWGTAIGSQQAYLSVPSNYSTLTKPCPVIIFWHGDGGTGYSLPIVISNGLPQLIAQGMKLEDIVSPTDGQKYSFIVVSPVNLDAAFVPLILDELEKEGYKIDRSRVYETGLSAGAVETITDVVTKDQYSKYTTAIVPMSAPWAMNPFDYTLLAKYQIRSWFFAGTLDAFTAKGKTYVDSCNKYYPNSSSLTLYPCGHGCWNTYYNTNYIDPVKNINIYQWMLQYSKASSITTLAVKFKSVKLIPKKK